MAIPTQYLPATSSNTSGGTSGSAPDPNYDWDAAFRKMNEYADNAPWNRPIGSPGGYDPQQWEGVEPGGYRDLTNYKGPLIVPEYETTLVPGGGATRHNSGGSGSGGNNSELTALLKQLLEQYQNPIPFKPDEADYGTKPGEREILMDRMLRAWLGLPAVEGQDHLEGNPAIDLAASITRGELPEVQRQAFQQQLDQNLADVTERFGQVGARWNSDLATRLGREAAEANVRLRSGIIDRANQYLTNAAGLQQGLVGIEASRSEAALQRLFQEFVANQNNPLISSLLPSLLGGL